MDRAKRWYGNSLTEPAAWCCASAILDWLRAYSNAEWDAPETRRIKRQIRDHFYPDTDDWREMVLFRSRQVVRQATAGLAGE